MGIRRSCLLKGLLASKISSLQLLTGFRSRQNRPLGGFLGAVPDHDHLAETFYSVLPYRISCFPRRPVPPPLSSSIAPSLHSESSRASLPTLRSLPSIVLVSATHRYPAPPQCIPPAFDSFPRLSILSSVFLRPNSERSRFSVRARFSHLVVGCLSHRTAFFFDEQIPFILLSGAPRVTKNLPFPTPRYAAAGSLSG